jgi:4-amino-4-deoxychorismate lyase
VTLLAVAVAGRGIVDPDEPVLNADDEALLRGRAAFETTRVYAGRPFKLDEHLARLAGSAARIGLPPVDVEQCESLASSALDAAGEPEAVLRLYWTAGREGSGRPTALALVSSVPTQLEEMRERGIKLIALPLGLQADLRAFAPWLLGGVKSTSYAVNMAAEAEARRRGADDAVFVDASGIVLEGPTTNVWWRRERALYTPSLDLGILAGVTRATVIELAGATGYEVEEGAYDLSELQTADEAFTSSSVREVMPVTALDDGPIARGTAADELQAALRRAAGATLAA